MPRAGGLQVARRVRDSPLQASIARAVRVFFSQPMPDSDHSFPGLPSHELRKIAVAAVCDPRTVIKYLRRKPIVDSGRIRIEQALRSLGRDDLVRAAGGAVAALAAGAK